MSIYKRNKSDNHSQLRLLLKRRKKISIADKKMDEIRVFLLKILTNLHKLLEEEQNDIQHTTSIK